MSGKLTEIATRDLLAKFGAGNHKPGSGSACALQGMIAAQLLRTVIDLTLDPKRNKSYIKFIPELQRIKADIELRVYTNLDLLFDKDSAQFDKVINLRIQRDKEKEPYRKKELTIETGNALQFATDIPIQIAELCLELGEYANYVFDNGFQSARGDSYVALNGAISTVLSCLSIVDLNLISLPVNKQTDKIRQRTIEIKNKHGRLAQISVRKLAILESESNEAKAFIQSVEEFRTGNLSNSVNTSNDIERIVRRFQNILWKQRSRIWKNENIAHPLKLLSPEVAFKKVMDYAFYSSESLGVYEQEGSLYEVAGIIDKSKKVVQVSKKFPLEIQNFTLAHELGHAILHNQTILHRDRPIDGPSATPRSREEMQADKFATYFLMPATLVREIFTDFFEAPKFVINEANVLAIRSGSISTLKNRCKNLRGLSRLIASTEYYGGTPFNSLAKVFNVSVETMAIRLEELNLVEF